MAAFSRFMVIIPRQPNYDSDSLKSRAQNAQFVPEQPDEIIDIPKSDDDVLPTSTSLTELRLDANTNGVEPNEIDENPPSITTDTNQALSVDLDKKDDSPNMPQASRNPYPDSFLVDQISYEEHLSHILKKFKIRNPVWTESRDGKTLQVTFVVDSGRKEEDVLDALLNVRIGKADTTSVSICPLTVCMGFEVKQNLKPISGSSNNLKGQLQSGKSSTTNLNKPAESGTDEMEMDSLKDNRVTLTDSVMSAKDVTFDSKSNTRVELLTNQEIIENQQEEEAEDETEEEDEEDDEETSFMKSIKSRIIVQPVIQSLRRNAEFTFDYMMFVILASVISAVGLIENNSVILVASMLISPIMGPILAGLFGHAVQDISLRNLGVLSELKGLAICILCGFLVGLPTHFIMSEKLHWKLASSSWPTAEIFGRGTPRNLLAGAVIALASGAAVALSVLGNNQGSLVGVAISASLLPPAVNAGLLWALAFTAAIIPPTYDMADHVSENVTADIVTTRPDCPPLLRNSYKPVFSCDLALDGFLLGVTSFGLTLLNIVLIIAAGWMFLKLKQVSPRTSIASEQEFWTNHVTVAKDYNTTIKGSNPSNLRKTMFNDIKQKFQTTDDEAEQRLNEAVTEAEYQNTVRWISPSQAFFDLEGKTPSGTKGTRHQKVELARHRSFTQDTKRVSPIRLPNSSEDRPLRRHISSEAKLESSKFGRILRKNIGRFRVAKRESSTRDKTEKLSV